MPRPGKPDPTYELLRMGLFQRLVREESVPLLDAEHWIQAWEAKEDGSGLPSDSDGHWDEAWRWINEERAARRRSLG